MTTLHLKDEAILLRQRPSGEKYISYAFITRNNGVVHALARRTTKPNSTFLPDIYDQGQLSLDKSKDGDARFFKEFELSTKCRGIGSNYQSLSTAAKITQLFLSNPIHGDSSEHLFQLAQKSLNALDQNIQPNAVLIKCLYLFSRYEGYPIKEDWFRNLSPKDSNHAQHILNQPLAKIQNNGQALASTLLSIQNYLERHTDIHL